MQPLPVMLALKRACHDLREDLGVTRTEVAGHLRKAESAVWRFENPEQGWPAGSALDETVAAYAAKCATTPRAIWERALTLAEAELHGASALDREVNQALDDEATGDDEARGELG